MSAREDAYARHQQQRWMRPDAYRWIRPDAARFLLPGTDPASVYPALDRKFNPSQPRVPAGNPDGGQWTDGDGSGTVRIAKPMGRVDLGEIGNLGLFQIAPRERDNSEYAQLAGDVPEGDSPGIGHNEGRRLNRRRFRKAGLPYRMRECPSCGTSWNGLERRGDTLPP